MPDERPLYFGVLSATEYDTMIAWAVSTAGTCIALLWAGSPLVVGKKASLLPIIVNILNSGMSSLQGYLVSFIYTPAGGTVLAAGIGLISAFAQFQVLIGCMCRSEYVASWMSMLPLLFASFSTQAVLSTFQSVGKLAAYWYLVLGTSSVVVDLLLAAPYLKALRGHRFWVPDLSATNDNNININAGRDEAEENDNDSSSNTKVPSFWILLFADVYAVGLGLLMIYYAAQAGQLMRGAHRVAMLFTVAAHLFATVVVAIIRMSRQRFLYMLRSRRGVAPPAAQQRPNNNGAAVASIRR